MRDSFPLSIWAVEHCLVENHNDNWDQKKVIDIFLKTIHSIRNPHHKIFYTLPEMGLPYLRLLHNFAEQPRLLSHSSLAKVSVKNRANLDKRRKLWYLLFRLLLPKIHFLRSICELGCVPTQFWVIQIFLNFLILESFGNSWGTSYKKLLYHIAKSCFTYGESKLH